jgi:peptidylprolyl isomerase
MGAAAVQLGTPFVATEECDAHIDFKRVLATARDEDVVEFTSVAGLPARAVLTRWLRNYLDALPRLLGRATVRLTTTKGDLITVVDGYNAPLTAGAFVDHVQRGFYDNLPFNRAEDFYVLQTGDPKGPADGYVDPKTSQIRRVPLEIRVPGQEEPYYNLTFEDLGLFKAEPTLPFNAKGTLGWAHSDQALDDGSSQFFLFLFEPELTPAGLNLIDGRYAAFGYVVDGFDVLEELTAADGIVRATVIEGADQLRPHA